MKKIDNLLSIFFGVLVGITVVLIMDYFEDNQEISRLKEANLYKHELILNYEDYRDAVECGGNIDEITDRIDSLYLQEL